MDIGQNIPGFPPEILEMILSFMTKLELTLLERKQNTECL